jgi:hypothetical protein
MEFAKYIFMGQRRSNITKTKRLGVIQRSLRQCFYLLARSCERYGKLKRSGAPDILVDAEKVLIRRRLLFLFNIDSDITN